MHISYISISPSPFSCFIHRPCCSRTVTLTPRFRLHRLRRALPEPKARVKRTSARAPRSLATWPIPRTPHFKAKDMLRKANKKKNGNHPTILSGWKEQESNRTSLAKHNIGEKEIMLHDQIALDNHDFIATKADRIQNSKHWVLSINAEGPQIPRQHRPDYAAAKRECQRLQDTFMADTKQLHKPIHPSKQMRQNPNQQLEGNEDYDYVVDRKTEWKWYKEQQGNLPHTSSSSSSSWQNSSWQNWNSWWWHSSKPDEGR